MQHAVGVLALASALAIGSQAAAADITYRGVQTFDGATVDLTLTTDGTVGGLLSSNFVSFDVTIYDAGGTATIDSANGEVFAPSCCGQYDLLATLTEITYDYSDFPVGGEDFLFQKGPIGAGGPFVCFSANVCWEGDSYGQEGANSQPSVGGGYSGALAAESASPDTFVIATAGVPESSAWTLSIVGLALCGGAWRLKRGTIGKVVRGI